MPKASRARGRGREGNVWGRDCLHIAHFLLWNGTFWCIKNVMRFGRKFKSVITVITK